MRQRLEYALAWPFIKALSLLPRPLSRAVAISLAWLVYLLHVRLRRGGMRNTAPAFPGEKPPRACPHFARGIYLPGTPACRGLPVSPVHAGERQPGGRLRRL